MSGDEQARLLNQITVLEGLIKKRKANERGQVYASSSFRRGARTFRLSRNVAKRAENVSRAVFNGNQSTKFDYRGGLPLRTPHRRGLLTRRSQTRRFPANTAANPRVGSRFKLTNVRSGDGLARETTTTSNNSECSNSSNIAEIQAIKSARPSASVTVPAVVAHASPSPTGGAVNAGNKLCSPLANTFDRRLADKSPISTVVHRSKAVINRRRIDRRLVKSATDQSRRIPAGKHAVVGSSANSAVASKSLASRQRSFFSLKNSKVLIHTSCANRLAKPTGNSPRASSLSVRAKHRRTPHRNVFRRATPAPIHSGFRSSGRRRSSGRLVFIEGRAFRTTSKTLQRTSLSPNKAIPRSAGKKLVNNSLQNGRRGGAAVYGQTSVAAIARRVKSRALRLSRSLNRQPCLYYCRRGHCPRYQPENSTSTPPPSHQCRLRHDPRLRPPCTTQLIMGVCHRYEQQQQQGGGTGTGSGTGAGTGTGCPFNHNPYRLKLPLCLHFLHGQCSRIPSCKLMHVMLDKDAPLCRRFLAGYCPLADQCESKHLYLCDEFWLSGTCSRRNTPAGCPLVHRQRRRNRQQHHSPQQPRHNSSHASRLSQRRRAVSTTHCSATVNIATGIESDYRRYYQTDRQNIIEGATGTDKNASSHTDDSFIRLPSCTTDDDDEEEEEGEDDESELIDRSRFRRESIGPMSSFVALASSSDDDEN